MKSLGTEIAKEPWCVLLKETHPLAIEYKTVIPLSALDGEPAAPGSLFSR